MNYEKYLEAKSRLEMEVALFGIDATGHIFGFRYVCDVVQPAELDKTNSVVNNVMHPWLQQDWRGLVPFGLILVGADSLVLNDRDYRRMWRKSRAINS